MKLLLPSLFLLTLPGLAQQATPTISPAGRGGAGPVLTLQAALQTALKNSLDVEISQTNEQVQQTRNTLGFAGGLPTVGIAASTNGVINNTSQEIFNASTGSAVNRAVTGAQSSQYAAGLTGSYLLYNGGRVHATRRRLDELEKISALQVNSTVQNVLADVSLKYYAVVQQQRYIRTLQASVEVTRQKLRLIETRQSVGLANNADKFQAELDLNAQLLTQQQQALAAQQATADLLRALTLDLNTPVAVEDSIPVSTTLSWPEIESALERNPDLQAAERQVAVQQLIERETQAVRFPSLSANGGTNFNRAQNAVGNTLFNQSYGPYAGLSVSVPLYTGGVNKRLVDIARLNTHTAELQRTALQRDYRLTTLKAWEGYRQQLQLVTTAEASYTTARKLLKLVQLRLDAGLSTLVDVKLAQQSFEDAGYRLVNYRYAAKAAEITLRQYAALLTP